MSVNIDRKKWRATEPQLVFSQPYLGFAHAFPLDTAYHRAGECEMSYDGEWIKLDEKITGDYPALGRSAFAITYGWSGANLRCHAVLKAPPNDNNIYFFFYEPFKGDYANYQGLDTRDGAEHNARSRNGGVETKTVLSGQDWTVEHRFGLEHEVNQSAMRFYIDGSVGATHTTNISAEPYEVLAGEPNGQIRTMYMRYPAGIRVSRSF